MKSEFKVGDKVREIKTGDTGVVIDRPAPDMFPGNIFVKWDGNDDDLVAGVELHIRPSDIELIAPEIPVAEMIKALIDAGYTVTKTQPTEKV